MRLWVVMLFALALTGCGIPLDSEPELVDVELAVVRQDPGPIPGDFVDVSMYLVSDGGLVEVARGLPTPTSAGDVLRSLFGPVTEPERRAGLRTAVPPDTQVISINEEGGLLEVDLSRQFASVGGEEEILAVAQIVLTAVSIDGIDLVAFSLDGVPTDVPVTGGALSDRPVGADDYSSLVAR